MANDKALQTQEMGINQKQWDLIGATTPADKIKTRPGRGGQTFKYVEAGYIVDLLNRTFNGMWDFKIQDQSVGGTQVWVRGELTVWLSPEIKVTKSQYGGSDIKATKEGKAVDIADDLKSASSDCLKKCASLFGFAQDIYWKEMSQGTAPAETRNREEIVGLGHPTMKQVNYINALCSQKGVDREDIKSEFNVESMKDLKYEDGQTIIKRLTDMPDVTSPDF